MNAICTWKQDKPHPENDGEHIEDVEYSINDGSNKRVKLELWRNNKNPRRPFFASVRYLCGFDVVRSVRYMLPRSYYMREVKAFLGAKI